MPSSWNHTSKSKSTDSFWLGFIPSFICPILLNIIIFKCKWTTEAPIFEAMYKLANKGFMTKDLMAALVPSLILIIVFSYLKKEKASLGAFVGLVPCLIIALVFA